LERETEIINRYVHGRLVLDVGCGPCVFERELGFKMVGVDPDKNALKFCSEDVIQGVGEYLPFKDNVFDAVLFITSMEFLLRPELAVSEAYRVLKNGTLLILMINQESNYFKMGSYISRARNNHKEVILITKKYFNVVHFPELWWNGEHILHVIIGKNRKKLK
jgi:ubiquinone/menaquinone biosynthesis C-methylase UbiE